MRPLRQRRHTLLLMEAVRGQSPILLDTDVDMSAVLADRDRLRRLGHAPSLISYVVWSAGRALRAHPEANAAMTGRRRPRMTRYQQITAKVAFDKRIGSERVVVGGLISDPDRAALSDIDETIARHKQLDIERAPEYCAIRLLHRLPWPAARLLFRAANMRLADRPDRLGTFSVSSLGHQPVDSFYPLGGTTVSIGIGRIRPQPVIRDGRLDGAPVMRLSLVFDHRIIDGALAADLLAATRNHLRSWGGAPSPDADGAAQPRAAALGTLTGRSVAGLTATH